MSATDPGNPLATGAVMASLPMDAMIGGPIIACIKAEAQAAEAYAEWINSACMKDGKPIMVPFEYEKRILDSTGAVTDKETVHFQIPLLAILQHPSIGIDKASIGFEMTVETSEATHSETAASGSFSAKAGWGPFSVKISGSVSHKSEQTRKTDTRSKYSVNVEVVHRGPTEAMSRVIEAVTNDALKPAKGASPAGDQDGGADPAPAADDG